MVPKMCHFESEYTGHFKSKRLCENRFEVYAFDDKELWEARKNKYKNNV